MSSPLQESSKSYERSANALEKVVKDHGMAMVCWDVEELIELGLGLVAAYERLDSRWRAGVRRGDPAFPIEQGLELREIAHTLTEGHSIVLELIRRIESKGYAPDGATHFRSISFLPFDQRSLEVHFSNEELHSLANLNGKAPEDDSD